MRRLLAIVTWSCFGFLLLFLALLEWKAELHWMLTVMLFAPPQLFLMPAAFLMLPCAVLRQWRLLAVNGAAVLFVIFGFMHWRWKTAPPRGAASLTLVTHNIGQGNRQQFIDFVTSQDPDVILLQDAKNRGHEFERRYPGLNVVERGEFICISKSLIQQSKLLDRPNWHGRPVVARFEVLIHGQPAAFYSVHLPTPRDQLSRLLGARAALAMFGNEELPGGKATLHEWNSARAELYRATADLIAQERLPCIAAGDFNMPDHGALYHRFSSFLIDSQIRAGSGFGFTFPGGMKSVVALLGPWLRIDYAFAGRSWEPVSCEPEPGLLSQHRAVAARFRSTSK
jgi:vancomycin resistance protein VanJ